MVWLVVSMTDWAAFRPVAATFKRLVRMACAPQRQNGHSCPRLRDLRRSLPIQQALCQKAGAEKGIAMWSRRSPRTTVTPFHRGEAGISQSIALRRTNGRAVQSEPRDGG